MVDKTQYGKGNQKPIHTLWGGWVNLIIQEYYCKITDGLEEKLFQVVGYFILGEWSIHETEKLKNGEETYPDRLT